MKRTPQSFLRGRFIVSPIFVENYDCNFAPEDYNKNSDFFPR